MENEEKVYMAIGLGRLLDIRVILDGNLIYEGRVEDAPEEVRNLKYSKADMGKIITYYVYSKYN